MLQTTHRPQTFKQFVGNTDLVESLHDAVSRKDFPRAYLFTGMPGSGKTTLACILRNYFKCEIMDYAYYNAASTRGIDTIREIAVDSQLSPMSSPVKIYVLDECHQITGAAAESMLLLLENPPPQTVFILCTSEPDKLKLSTKRRCFQVNLKSLTNAEINKVLSNVLAVEEVDDMPPTVLTAITKGCLGSAGMAMSMLDAVIDILEEEAQLSVIASMRGVVETEGIEICQALNSMNWDTLRKLLNDFTGSEESLRHMILSYFTTLLLAPHKKTHARASLIIMMFSDSFIYSKKAGLVNACYMSCLEEE